MEVIKIRVGQLKTNCYLLISGNEAVVIDPGGDEDIILNEIKKHSVKLIYIINTHYHFDHTLANEDLRETTGVQVLIHEDEKEFSDFTVDKFLRDRDEIKFGKAKLKVIHTPGHTAGGICLLSDDVIFTGDTLFKDTYGRTDLDGGSADDMEKSLAMLGNIIKPDMHVYPGHGHDFIQ
jgi:hydroxyacylglutathione hydrolase